MSVGSYDEETNIEEINTYVVRQLKEQSNTEKQKSEIDALEKRLESKSLRPLDAKLIKTTIDRLKREVESTERSLEKEYLERVSPILDEWLAMKKKEGPHFRFGEKKEFSPLKLSLTRSFIQVASEYVPLDLNLKMVNVPGTCPYCRNMFVEENGKSICFECGLYHDELIHDVEFSDVSRINSSNNNSYINRETFIKALMCFQGKQKVEFCEEIWLRFDDYCSFNRVQKRSLNYEQTRPIFKSIGFSNHFDDINLFLFMHKEIKRPLPNITEHEDNIIRDYDQFSQKYAEEKGDERDSALNAWYLLFILCRRRKIDCRRTDLKMPDTLAIRISNDNIARRVFTALEWTFEDTV